MCGELKNPPKRVSVSVPLQKKPNALSTSPALDPRLVRQPAKWRLGGADGSICIDVERVLLHVRHRGMRLGFCSFLEEIHEAVGVVLLRSIERCPHPPLRPAALQARGAAREVA